MAFFPRDNLDDEHRALQRYGRLSAVQWGVLVLSLFATIAGWLYAQRLEDARITTRFNYEADQIPGLVRERLQKYELALQSGVSMIRSSRADIDWETWATFADSLDIETLYPGVNGIGVIYEIQPDDLPAFLADQRETRPDFDIHPPHDKDILQPITFIYPVDSNKEAVGLDMAHETNRHTAFNKARDTATPQITGPIILVQDAARTPGFLFFAPFYDGLPPATESARRDSFAGAVYAPFIVQKLVEGTLDQNRRSTLIRISDGDTVIYDELSGDSPDYDPDALGEKRIMIDLYGRAWAIDIQSGLAFRAGISPNRPLAVLLIGVAVDGALLALFLYLMRGNRRGLRFAKTLQHHAEAQASRAMDVSARLSAVMDAAHSGIVGLSSNGEIAILNSRARHLLGNITKEPPFRWPQNITFLEAEDLKPLEASADPINRALAGQLLEGETSIMSRSAGDEPRYIRISSAKIQKTNSYDIETVVVFDDVTDQEKSRQQIERASRLEALGQLTGGIAHDFNNLLATMEYSIQLASDTDDKQKRNQFLNAGMNSVRRGSALVRRLLAFAKKQPGLAKSHAVNDLLAEFAELARPTIQANINLDFNREDGLWVFCDVGQLENALLNLVLNARDAIVKSGKGDTITVKARGIAEAGIGRQHKDTNTGTAPTQEAPGGYADRFVEISVTDNGPGMEAETKRRAIDPFFTTKDNNAGTGLGLSMVYGFVQQSDGTMTIYSEADHGTTVRITLPRGTPDGNREEPIARLPTPFGQGQTVLVTEDEEDLLSLMGNVVRSLGYQVLGARNGEIALEILSGKTHVDLLLTDIVMPGGIGGFQLAARARELRPDLRVIYMSGYTGFSASEMGDVVAPLIEKPSPPSILANALKTAFDTD